jgi:hypothetical protein
MWFHSDTSRYVLVSSVNAQDYDFPTTMYLVMALPWLAWRRLRLLADRTLTKLVGSHLASIRAMRACSSMVSPECQHHLRDGRPNVLS